MRTPLDAVQALDRLRLLTPATAISFTRHVVGASALNARSSLETITASVRDRRQLLGQLQGPSAPGDVLGLSERECRELLATRTVGRLAYLARAGIPDIVPVNYVLQAEAVLVRSGPGPKLQAAERRDVVAFEVDAIDESTRTGWSVVVVGRAEPVPSGEASAMTLPLPWANGPRRHTLRIRPQRITGRQLL